MIVQVSAETEPEEMQAVISARSDAVAVNESIVLNASHSNNPFPERPIVYSWNFGDGRFGSGESVEHIFKTPGAYEVELTMQAGGDSDKVSFQIFAYERAIMLVSDKVEQEQKIATLAEASRGKNVFLDVVWGSGVREGFFAEESAIASALQEEINTLRHADLIVLLTGGSNGLNGLTRFAQEQSPPFDFSKKRIAVITESSLDSLAKIARGSFSTISPAEMLLADSEALRDIVLSDPNENVAISLEQQAIPHRVITSGLEKFSIITPLSSITNYLIAEGIPASVILLVLLLPAIAMLVAFFKQVVGLTTFGVYTPSVLTLSFLAIGLKLGLAVLCVVVLTSVLIRKILRKRHLAYTPRLAIILTFVALAIFLAIALFTWLTPFGAYTITADLIAASIFPMLIMSTLAEKFASIQTEKGSRSAVRLFLEVIFVSLVCYFVVGKWEYLHTLILSTPEVIFLFLIADIIIGRFTGLRLTEYIRFRDVIKKVEEE